MMKMMKLLDWLKLTFRLIALFYWRTFGFSRSRFDLLVSPFADCKEMGVDHDAIGKDLLLSRQFSACDKAGEDLRLR